MQYFGILGELTFPQYILYMYIEVCVQNIVNIYRNEIQKVPVTRCDSQLVLQKNGKVLVNIKIMLQKTHLKKILYVVKNIEYNYLQ